MLRMGSRVEGFVTDRAPVDAGWLLLVPPVDVGEALGIGGLDDVQQVIRAGRLEHAAHPLSAFDRIAAEVEDDGDAEA